MKATRSETGQTIKGGREALIGLSRRDVSDLRLVARRLRDYIDEGAFVHPEDLEWSWTVINDLVGGVLPWPAHDLDG